jgi:predicted ribosomally synthesized peptide with SipW-like signal peptide
MFALSKGRLLMRKVRYLSILLIILFSLIGGAYAAWSDTLTVSGTATTGHMDVIITEARAANLDGRIVNGSIAVPYVYSGEGNGVISADGKSATMSVVNIYPSNFNTYQNFQIRIRNNSSIPVKLDSVVFSHSGSDAVWNHLKGTIHFSVEGPPYKGYEGTHVPSTAVNPGQFNFRSSIKDELEKLMNTHGDLLPDQTARFSIPYWLAFSAENDAQDQPIEFTLTFNWKQFNK